MPPTRIPTTIAVGFDGSPDAVRALAWAAGLAATTGARLVVIHAVGLLEHAGIAGRSTAHREAVLGTAAGAGLGPERVEWSVADGDPCSVLLRATEGPDPADLLVVGSRGAGGHPGSVLGSTSLELAERVRTPLVIVPEGHPVTVP